jgi:UDP-N-acetylmuramate--alanine ligase
VNTNGIFLHLEPDILVITNIELDHVDYYKDWLMYKVLFHDLALKVLETGFIVTDTTNENINRFKGSDGNDD